MDSYCENLTPPRGRHLSFHVLQLPLEKKKKQFGLAPNLFPHSFPTKDSDSEVITLHNSWIGNVNDWCLDSLLFLSVQAYSAKSYVRASNTSLSWPFTSRQYFLNGVARFELQPLLAQGAHMQIDGLS